MGRGDCACVPVAFTHNCAASVRIGEQAEKENPGALAGATGEHSTAFWDQFQRNTRRSADASRLIDAVFACDPDDRLWLVEMIFDQLRPHEPDFAPDHHAMIWARGWVQFASRAERKAFALACFEALAEPDRAAFLDYVNGRAAA